MPDANIMNVYSIVYFSLIIVGLILAFVSMMLKNASSIPVTITSYSCLAVGILLVMSTLLYGKRESMTWTQMFTFFKVNLGPFLVILALIGYLLYLTIYYKNLISNGHLSGSYYTFNTISLLLICMQVGILYNAMKKPSFESTGNIPLTHSAFLYLLGTINFVFALTMGVILKYFSTDGFTSRLFHL